MQLNLFIPNSLSNFFLSSLGTSDSSTQVFIFTWVTILLALVPSQHKALSYLQSPLPPWDKPQSYTLLGEILEMQGFYSVPYLGISSGPILYWVGSRPSRQTAGAEHCCPSDQESETDRHQLHIVDNSVHYVYIGGSTPLDTS